MNSCVSPAKKLLLTETPSQLMYRAKKDGTKPIADANAAPSAPNLDIRHRLANTISHRSSFDGLEAPLGSLSNAEELDEATLFYLKHGLL